MNKNKKSIDFKNITKINTPAVLFNNLLNYVCEEFTKILCPESKQLLSETNDIIFENDSILIWQFIRIYTNKNNRSGLSWSLIAPVSSKLQNDRMRLFVETLPELSVVYFQYYHYYELFFKNYNMIIPEVKIAKMCDYLDSEYFENPHKMFTLTNENYLKSSDFPEAIKARISEHFYSIKFRRNSENRSDSLINVDWYSTTTGPLGELLPLDLVWTKVIRNETKYRDLSILFNIPLKDDNSGRNRKK